MEKFIKQIWLSFLIIIVILYLMVPCDSKIFGKPLWPCPYDKNRLLHLYIPESDGTYTSQSLFDIYSFTHISHGMIIFYILYYLHGYSKNKNMIYYSLIYAFIFEIGWEIIENTPFIIKKYRDNSAESRNYKGDSIINSIGDVMSMFIGFLIAWKYTKESIYLLIINELLLYYFIHDNLLKNIYEVFIK
jgi:hypothetical protein